MSALYDTQLLKKVPVANGTVEFRIQKPAGLEYKAGQYFDLILKQATPDAPLKDYRHEFSFVSAPYEDYIASTTRMRAESHFKQALAALPDGAPLQVEAVWGSFTLRHNTSRAMVFLIGGVGITPVMSMVKQATHDHTDHKLVLFYANRTRADAAYVDELLALAKKNPNFRFIQVYENEPGLGDAVEHGRISDDIVKRHVPDLDHSAFYMSGPRGMIYAMRELLERIDVDEDYIKTEEFTGY